MCNGDLYSEVSTGSFLTFKVNDIKIVKQFERLLEAERITSKLLDDIIHDGDEKSVKVAIRILKDDLVNINIEKNKILTSLKALYFPTLRYKNYPVFINTEKCTVTVDVHNGEDSLKHLYGENTDIVKFIKRMEDEHPEIEDESDFIKSTNEQIVLDTYSK